MDGSLQIPGNREKHRYQRYNTASWKNGSHNPGSSGRAGRDRGSYGRESHAS